jgi:hypothetical protein
MYSLALIIFVVSEKKAGHRLTLDPMGKCSNAFFSETTNMIKAILYMNVHWMVIYKLHVSMNMHVQFGFNHICSF